MTTSTYTPQTQADQFGVGNCLAVREHNGYNDSDFSGLFAVPNDDGGLTFTWAETGTTRFAGGYVPHKDITDPAIVAAYTARREQVLAEVATARAAEQEKIPTVGKQVVFVKAITRGKNKTEVGTVATVVARDTNPFDSAWTQRYGHRSYRLKVSVPGKFNFFTDEDRVRVVGHETEEIGAVYNDIDGLIVGSWPLVTVI